MIRRLKACLKNRFFRSFITFLVMTGFILFLGLFCFLFYFERKALDYDIEAVGRLSQETVILDATDTPIGYLHGKQGSNLQLGEVSKHFLDALIAREDTRFWKHHGVDHLGLLRANWRNIRERKVIQGASTITMQLSRMTFDLRERNYKRKLIEMAIARRIERHYSKEEILRLYVNRIYLGTETYGIAQASDAYLGKHPSQLNLSESAMLAGIIRAPNRFSPFRHPDRARNEMVMTLLRMGVEGMITRTEADRAKANMPTILPQERWMEIRSNNLKIYRRDWIINMVDAKLEELVPESKVFGGYTIKTTIDHRVQKSSTASLHKWLSGVERANGYEHPIYPARNSKNEPVYLQGSGVVIDNQNGAIRALVGGRDYQHSAFNRAIHANRQAGSIIKPLVYATAFETGLFPGTYISDERIRPGEFKWWKGPAWDPVNADGIHQGLRPAKEGLIKSRNTMTVRVGETAQYSNVVKMLNHAGIEMKGKQDDPQIYIGNLPVSLLSITSAYTAFPMQGVRFEPYLIESIHDSKGQQVYKHESKRYQVFSPEAAWMTSSILEKVVEAGGSGARLRQWGFQAPAAGKTGTTDDFVDAWFVGYTSRLTGGFWLGLDQPAPMLAGAYGGRVAMPVWKDVMDSAAEIGYQFKPFAKPGEIFSVEICRHTGLLASPACKSEGSAYKENIPSSLIPREFCRREESN